jgi:hypothetical protein
MDYCVLELSISKGVCDMRGVVLIDQEIENNRNYVHFMIYRHGPEYDSGTWMYVMFIENRTLKKAIKMGWANVCFLKFLETLQQFPNGKPTGTYYKYEPEMEQTDWSFDEATGLYTLTFTIKKIPSRSKQARSKL